MPSTRAQLLNEVEETEIEAIIDEAFNRRDTVEIKKRDTVEIEVDLEKTQEIEVG